MYYLSLNYDLEKHNGYSYMNEKKQKTNGSQIKIIVVILILVLLGGGYYIYLGRGNSGSKKDADEVSTMTKVLAKNLDTEYFQTPREVVEYYSDIMYCYYSEEYSEEQLKMLTEQARKCMDAELLEGNPYEDYYASLKAELQEYKDEGRKLSTYIVDKNSEVNKFKEGGKSYARLSATYYMKGKKDTRRTSQEYTLRQDEEGRWKILYWSLSSKDE